MVSAGVAAQSKDEPGQIEAGEIDSIINAVAIDLT